MYIYIYYVKSSYCSVFFSFFFPSLSYSILISFNKIDIFVPILAEIGIIGK